jgi:hypothetical protein
MAFLVCLFCFSAAGSSRAHASCGDYLAHHDMARRGVVDNGLMVVGRHAAPTDGSPSRRQCHGAACHQGPLSAPLSTPVVPFEFHDRWLATTIVDLPASGRTSFLSLRSDLIALPMSALRLERPPRS